MSLISVLNDQIHLHLIMSNKGLPKRAVLKIQFLRNFSSNIQKKEKKENKSNKNNLYLPCQELAEGYRDHPVQINLPNKISSNFRRKRKIIWVRVNLHLQQVLRDSVILLIGRVIWGCKNWKIILKTIVMQTLTT